MGENKHMNMQTTFCKILPAHSESDWISKNRNENLYLIVNFYVLGLEISDMESFPVYERTCVC